jgi:hypothetical protein
VEMSFRMDVLAMVPVHLAGKTPIRPGVNTGG